MPDTQEFGVREEGVKEIGGGSRAEGPSFGKGKASESEGRERKTEGRTRGSGSELPVCWDHEP